MSLGLAALTLTLLPFDQDLLRLINASGTGSLAPMALFIDQYLPRILILAGMVVGLACWFGCEAPRCRQAGLGLAFLPFLAGAAMSVPKRLVGRARPQLADWDWSDLNDLVQLADEKSFPSGHVTTATVFAIVAGWLFSHRTGRGILLLLIPLMMWDRLACLVHFPSDTAAGATLGCLAALAWRHALSRFDPRPGAAVRWVIIAALAAFTVFLWRDLL